MIWIWLTVFSRQQTEVHVELPARRAKGPGAPPKTTKESPSQETSKTVGPPFGQPWYDPARDDYVSANGEYLGRVLPRVSLPVSISWPILTFPR